MIVEGRAGSADHSEEELDGLGDDEGVLSQPQSLSLDSQIR